MVLFDKELKIGTPIFVGIGALILAPVVIPFLGTIAKPLVKAAIKSGLVLVHRGRELMSEAAEALEDITAEVKAELIAERAGHAASPQPDEIVSTNSPL